MGLIDLTACLRQPAACWPAGDLGLPKHLRQPAACWHPSNQVTLTKGDAPGPERGVPPRSPPPLPMAGPPLPIAWPPLPMAGPPLPRPPDPAPEMPFWAGWGCPKLSSPKPPNPASPLLVAPELGCRRAGSHGGRRSLGTAVTGKSGQGQPACRRQRKSICPVIGRPGWVLLMLTSKAGPASGCVSVGTSAWHTVQDRALPG